MEVVYQTEMGCFVHGDSIKVLDEAVDLNLRGNVDLIFTSPPFPLNRRKRYGNKNGNDYIEWLAGYADLFSDLLSPTGSIVMEMGNAWVKGSPTMSTLAIESLLELKKRGGFHLCQEFIWDNPARLPSPAQWVNVERSRVKDSFTRLWWLSKNPRPKADNRRVLKSYSPSMKRLLEKQTYNYGKRPSEHHIGSESFLTNNGGSIPSNVLTIANTRCNDPYMDYCRKNDIVHHPARMPPDLAKFFINFLTVEGDLVFDPFSGSNTTGRVAEDLKRRWVSVEIDKEYAMASMSRFQPRELTEVNFELRHRIEDSSMERKNVPRT